MLSATVVASAVLASCDKDKDCKDCHYDTDAGEVEIGERCGDDIKALEKSGYEVNDSTYTVHCEEH